MFGGKGDAFNPNNTIPSVKHGGYCIMQQGIGALKKVKGVM